MGIDAVWLRRGGGSDYNLWTRPRSLSRDVSSHSCSMRSRTTPLPPCPLSSKPQRLIHVLMILTRISVDYRMYKTSSAQHLLTTNSAATLQQYITFMCVHITQEMNHDTYSITFYKVDLSTVLRRKRSNRVNLPSSQHWYRLSLHVWWWHDGRGSDLSRDPFVEIIESRSRASRLCTASTLKAALAHTIIR